MEVSSFSGSGLRAALEGSAPTQVLHAAKRHKRLVLLRSFLSETEIEQAPAAHGAGGLLTDAQRRQAVA